MRRKYARRTGPALLRIRAKRRVSVCRRFPRELHGDAALFAPLQSTFCTNAQNFPTLGAGTNENAYGERRHAAISARIAKAQVEYGEKAEAEAPAYSPAPVSRSGFKASSSSTTKRPSLPISTSSK